MTATPCQKPHCDLWHVYELGGCEDACRSCGHRCVTWDELQELRARVTGGERWPDQLPQGLRPAAVVITFPFGLAGLPTAH